MTEQLARLAPDQAATPGEPARAMPAQQGKPAQWGARLNLTLTPEMKRALDLARIDDGIEATFRIRAMISLWQEDDRLRSRVDKRAQADRQAQAPRGH